MQMKSYVLRTGRVSPRQQNALDHGLQEFELKNTGQTWDLLQIFGRKAETIVEIGFGMGASLVEMAVARPDQNFIGIEVHRAGLGAIVADLQNNSMTNVRIAPVDAVEIFDTCLADNSITGVQIFFPDPWPKKRHHKRRLVQPDFISRLVKKIRIGGLLHCATDWQPYAEHMLAVLSSEPYLQNQSASKDYVARPNLRPLTKFEKRGLLLGHGVWDLLFMRT